MHFLPCPKQSNCSSNVNLWWPAGDRNVFLFSFFFFLFSFSFFFFLFSFFFFLFSFFFFFFFLFLFSFFLFFFFLFFFFLFSFSFSFFFSFSFLFTCSIAVSSLYFMCPTVLLFTFRRTAWFVEACAGTSFNASTLRWPSLRLTLERFSFLCCSHKSEAPFHGCATLPWNHCKLSRGGTVDIWEFFNWL